VYPKHGVVLGIRRGDGTSEKKKKGKVMPQSTPIPESSLKEGGQLNPQKKREGQGDERVRQY